MANRQVDTGINPPAFGRVRRCRGFDPAAFGGQNLNDIRQIKFTLAAVFLNLG